MVSQRWLYHIIRIPEEELKIIYLRVEKVFPALHIIEVYLDVEANTTVDESRKTGNKFKNKIYFNQNKGESVITLENLNSPINNSKITYGKRLLIE